MEKKEWNKIVPLREKKRSIGWETVLKKALIALGCAILAFVFLFPVAYRKF